MKMAVSLSLVALVGPMTVHNLTMCNRNWRKGLRLDGPLLFTMPAAPIQLALPARLALLGTQPI